MFCYLPWNGVPLAIVGLYGLRVSGVKGFYGFRGFRVYVSHTYARLRQPSVVVYILSFT